jgi:hypothetical protein
VLTVLQSIANLTGSVAGAIAATVLDAAMVFAIIRLAQRKLRNPIAFIGGTLVAVAICRISYFVLVGPIMIAYLLAIRSPKRPLQKASLH